MQESQHEVILLTFIAASDGVYDDDECDEVVKHVFARFPEEGLREDAVRRRVRSFVPDKHAFRRAPARLCTGSGDPRALMRSMRRTALRPAGRLA